MDRRRRLRSRLTSLSLKLFMWLWLLGSGYGGVEAGTRILFHDAFDFPAKGRTALDNWLIADGTPFGPEPGTERHSWNWGGGDGRSVDRFATCQFDGDDAIAFARTIVPKTATASTITFRLRGPRRGWSLVIGSSQPLLDHDGIEIAGPTLDPKDEAGREKSPWITYRFNVEDGCGYWSVDGIDCGIVDLSDVNFRGYVGIHARRGLPIDIDDVTITIDEPEALAKRRRPNVLFIAVDDLRNDLGCYGNPQVVSPNIDALAASGVRFDRAYCQYPLCNQSRTSLLTGLRPDSNGCNRNDQLNVDHFRNRIPEVLTLPQLFQRHGYQVGRVGKIYHYGVPREIGTESRLDDRSSWQFSLFPRGDERDEEHRLINLTPTRSIGWAIGWYPSDVPASHHTDGKVASEAIRLLDDDEVPFFLAVGFYRPHMPATAPRTFYEPYPLDQIRLPDEPDAHFDAIPKPAFDPRLRVDAEPVALREFKRSYYATVTFLDEQVGRLLQALDDRGLREETIVVLWSDHGWMLGEHRQWEKRVLFEEAVRVPMIIRAPGASRIVGGSQRVVELVDIYPTLAELCGLDVPEPLDGRSLMPILDGVVDDHRGDWPDEAFTQISRNGVVGHSIRTARWRFTRWNYGLDGEELYDHDTDPRELRNLADSTDFDDVLERLRNRLDQQFD